MSKIIRLTESDLVRLVNRVIKEQKFGTDFDATQLKKLLSLRGFKLIPNPPGGLASGWVMTKGMLRAEMHFEGSAVILTDKSKGQEVRLPPVVNDEQEYSISYNSIDKNWKQVGGDKTAKLNGQEIIDVCDDFAQGNDLFNAISIFSHN